MPSAIAAAGSPNAIYGRAARDAFAKLDPRKLAGNPVILATEVVAVLATFSTVAAFHDHQSPGFALQIAAWLWATVLFANFAESVAEGRGKAAADSLRAARVDTKAKLIIDPERGTTILTPATRLNVPAPTKCSPTRTSDRARAPPATRGWGVRAVVIEVLLCLGGRDGPGWNGPRKRENPGPEAGVIRWSPRAAARRDRLRPRGTPRCRRSTSRNSGCTWCGKPTCGRGGGRDR